MSFGLSDIGDIFSSDAVKGYAIGGPIGGLVGLSSDASKDNAAATKAAAEAAAQATLEATRLTIAANKEAAALAEQAARTRRAEDIAAANAAKAQAEQYLQQAIPLAERAIQQGADTSNAEFAQALGYIKQAYQGEIQTGAQADERIRALTLGTPEEAQNALTLDPGYQFRLKQGQQALERSQLGRGNLLSGASGIELQKYGQGMASDEFTNAYNRLMGLSSKGTAAKGITTGYDWANAGIRSSNAQNVAGTKAQNALNLANVQGQGAWNVANASMGGNANVGNAVSTGGWNVAGASSAGAQNNANALSNMYQQNAQADIMRNNFWPQMGWQAVNTGVQLAPIAFGAGGGGAAPNQYQSNYNPNYQPNSSLNMGGGYFR